MAIDWAKLRAGIINGSVATVNGLLYKGLAKAQRDVPVRRVFQGDRRSLRFKTAAEIEGDRELRSRLGLAPERLATPQAIAAVRRAGVRPTSSGVFGGRVEGFARTVSRRDRANSWKETADRRLLDESERYLEDENSESLLSGRGRYEVRSGRAVALQRIYGGRVRAVNVDLHSGAIRVVGGDRLGGRPTVGGGLRSTLRVEEAHADQFPVIKGSLIAGDREHDYAKYQELGTRHNAAHPYLRPRLLEWKNELPAQLRRGIQGRFGR